MSRCCIIYNEPREGALADELDVLDQVAHIEKNMIELGISVYRKGITENFMSEVAELANEKPDFVFNLVESINNKGELNYFVPALAEFIFHFPIPVILSNQYSLLLIKQSAAIR